MLQLCNSIIRFEGNVFHHLDNVAHEHNEQTVLLHISAKSQNT